MLAMLEDPEEREGEGHTVPIGGLDGKTNVPAKNVIQVLEENKRSLPLPRLVINSQIRFS